jgi:ribosome biogenesis GTPase / thiamine phosphate phosphatase
MPKGLIIKSTGSWCTVDTGAEIIRCRIKGKFRINNIVTTNPVTVGDRVEFDLSEDGTGMIKKIEERRNYIIRRSTSFNKEANLLASNIDQAFIMVCIRQPVTQYEFLDRFLITAEAYHIQSIILINKIDLLKEKDLSNLKKLIHTYEIAGYECIETSIALGLNMDKVTERMDGKISLLAGNSGVGKSSLLNFLRPELKLKTEEISGSHQSGKHTTTFSEVIKFGTNTFVIDTPGIRGFGLIDMQKSEIGLYFPEIFRISKDCRFYNCTHIHEPGCAVAEAVRNGQIGESRFNSYISIMTEDGSKYR